MGGSLSESRGQEFQEFVENPPLPNKTLPITGRLNQALEPGQNLDRPRDIPLTPQKLPAGNPSSCSGSRSAVDNLTEEQYRVRASVAEAAARRGAVRAMAAKFESGKIYPSSPSPALESERQSITTQTPLRTPISSRQPSRKEELRKELSHGRSWKNSQKSSDQDLKHSKKSATKEGPATFHGILNQPAALAISKGQKPKAGLERFSPSSHKQQYSLPMPETRTGSLFQEPPSLGTIVPYSKQPPIAQHLRLLRPSSSSPNLVHDMGAAPWLPFDTPTPIPRPGSTTLLYSQIRHLQRQLDIRYEEMAQLRRQLEAQEDTDVGTLSQQLREEKREGHMWRERAEAAERRIKVFERFAARLRSNKEVAVVEDSPLESNHTGIHVDGVLDSSNPEAPNTFDGLQDLGLRRCTKSPGRLNSRISRRTDDPEAIAQQIRDCLQGDTGKFGASNNAPMQGLDAQLSQTEMAGSRNLTNRNISETAVEIWMAAQELLCSEENETV